MEKNKIFLSHRHSDTQSDCHRIRETLEEEFGVDAVFLDIENLEPGIRFADAIEKALTESKVVLVAIGPDWFGDPDENGVTRLFQHNDWVRREVSAALSRSDTRVIPLLLKGASRPTADQLPEDLKDLADLQTFEISITRWKYDLGVLVEALAKLIPKKKRPINPIPPRPTPTPKPKGWWAKNYLWVLGVFVILLILIISSEEFQEGYQKGVNGSYVEQPTQQTPAPVQSSTISVQGNWVLYLNKEPVSHLVLSQYPGQVEFIEYNALNVNVGNGSGELEANEMFLDYYNSVVDLTGELYLTTQNDGISWEGTIHFPSTGTSNTIALRRN